MDFAKLNKLFTVKKHSIEGNLYLCKLPEDDNRG